MQPIPFNCRQTIQFNYHQNEQGGVTAWSVMYMERTSMPTPYEMITWAQILLEEARRTIEQGPPASAVSLSSATLN